jgi:hypothetical protein
MHQPKILFILKKKKLYDDPGYAKTIHSGLFNSAQFVNDMLKHEGVDSHCVQVNDNNDIDRVVTKYRPKIVIIEALWVVPEKFEILHKLHPHVKWIIRLHSEIPFIANEGIAMEWIYKYSEIAERDNVWLAPNTEKMFNDLNQIGIKRLRLLPNYYPVLKNKVKRPEHKKSHIDIGCFGAIRPMKNQLLQAVAAIEFGNEIGKSIHFHINTERIEKGETVIRNIRALFAAQTKHKLIEHPWYNHHEFVKLISQMDLGMQVSLNETFNIVAADFASKNIPVIGSSEINWLNFLYKAKTTSSESIVKKLKLAYRFKDCNLQKLNKNKLKKVSEMAKEVWLKFVYCSH